MTRTPLLILTVITLSCLLTGCAGGGSTPVPSVAVVEPQPKGAAVLTSMPPRVDRECGDMLASARPPDPMPRPGQMPAGSTMARIAARGKLIVGVNQNTFNMGFRDPFTGQVDGFDIELARQIAKAIFGTAEAIQLRTLNSEQRVPTLKSGEVDLVVQTMSITCDRLREVAFSTVYYDAQQRVLVKKNSGLTGMDSLGGRRVCATSGSTSLRNIAEARSRPVPVSVPDWTDCLVMLQQGQVEAISTDDVILAGMVSQDRYTEVVGPPIANEPYGVAVPLADQDLLRFVNGVLERVRADGTWSRSYEKWLGGLLPGAPPAPPTPRYRD